MPRKIPTNFSFEIINITPVNPYISECQIKVFYTGKNRNGSYISKPVGEKIAQTLPRSPIVAYYNEEIEDFEDHGQELIINKNGILLRQYLMVRFLKMVRLFGNNLLMQTE